MTTSNKTKIIDIAEKISTNLAFRQSADDFYHNINKLKDSKIAVDFSAVTFMTSSFAHQYLLNKRKSEKHITETNIPPNIHQMFELVEKRKNKPKNISDIAPKILEVAV